MQEHSGAEDIHTRSETADLSVSVEVLKSMIRRLCSCSYESTISLRQDLTFDFTGAVFSKKGLKFGSEQMRSLRMVDSGRFTNLAFMLSDQFDVPVKAALFQDEFRTFSWIVRNSTDLCWSSTTAS